MLRAVLALAAALTCCSVVALAQPDKKGDAGKSKEELKGKGKDPSKDKILLDKAKLPKDAIIVLVEDILEAAQIYGKSVVLSFEEYQELREKLKALERQLKPDKKTPFSCKLLDGKLEGDFLVLRAEYGFSTEQPKTSVLLGLQGGHLLDEGDLDGKAPILDYTDDGFVARVEKEGTHQLTLKFRVPVQSKKTTGSIERGINLGLPGAALTIVDLQLPTSVKELRWNETVEKTKTPGRWLLGFEKAKALSLAWNEPTPIQGNTPLAKAEGQIHVRIDETHVNISAEIFLEDVRPQTKEWQLLLPAQAKVTEVKTPTGAAHAFTLPEPGAPYWRIADLTPGRWQVSITQRVPRPAPGAKIPVGLYHVLGAFQHHGTITVQMPADVSFGQRLMFTRNAETHQVKNTDTEATFQYTATPAPGTKAALAIKAPVELEWRNEKNQLETQVDHTLKLKTVQQGWELETTTRIQVKALSAFNAVELKLPSPRPRGMSVLAVAPMESFPAGLPWGGIWKTFGGPSTFAMPEDSAVFDDNGNPLKLVAQDAAGTTRVIAERAPAKSMTLIVRNTIKAAPEQQRIRVELPRPLNTIDRGAKLSIQSDERVELVHGPEGAEEPVPERHRFDFPLDQAPSMVDIAWRPFEREVVAQATLDITVFEHTAQVRQRLSFPRDRAPAGFDSKNPLIAFKVPRAIKKVDSGGDTSTFDPAKQMLWLKPKDGADKIEVILEYDLAVAHKKAGAEVASSGVLHVTPLWPVHVSQKDVKVRVWCRAGLQARFADDAASRGVWKERGIEVVKDKEHFPSLVLQGYGADLPLTLKIDESAATPMAAFLADRALIQVRMGDDDSQQCRARYWIRKIHATHVEIELPLSVSRLRDLHFTLAGRPIFAEKKDVGDKVVRLPLHPELVAAPAILEVRYAIPADGMERNYFWKTTLHAPSFRSDVVIREMRWQFNAPTPMMAASLSRKARPQNQWSVQSGLLTPEPAVTSAELDAWLTGADSLQPAESVTYVFAHAGTQSVSVYHLPRTWWLLGCSGLLLIVALGAYFSPLPRSAFWVFLLVLGFGLLTLQVVCPALLPPILFGLQPGVVLLFVVMGVYWILQERYRRQLVFLPGFTRTKPGSTVLRSSGSQRPREASTLAAPPEDSEPAPTPPTAS